MTRPGDEYMVELGDYLGWMTDELKDYGEKARILEFVSTGAKSYSYVIDKGDGTLHSVTKVKGFSLNCETEKKIDMPKMVEMVKQKCDKGVIKDVTITNMGIRRTKEHQLVTQTVKKTFQVTADKRKIVPGTYETRPFGFHQ